MGTHELVHRFTIPAKIYDTSLPQQLHDAMSVLEHSPQSDLYYRFEINFNPSIYKDSAFFEYPLEKTPEAKYKGKSPSKEDLLYAILSEQLNATGSVAKTFGYDFINEAITGTASVSPDTVEVLIQIDRIKEPPKFDKKGNEMHPLRMRGIMPDQEQWIENVSKGLAQILAARKKRLQQEKIVQDTHVPNMITAGSFFTAISRALLPYTPDESLTHLADKLRKNSKIISQWPLEIVSTFKAERCIHPSTEIDCPEIVIFQRFRDGVWAIRPIANLKDAQQFIKNAFQYKKTSDLSKITDCVAVLHNLEPMPYSLFMETDNGIEKIDPVQITRRMKLHVSWEKTEKM